MAATRWSPDQYLQARLRHLKAVWVQQVEDKQNFEDPSADTILREQDACVKQVETVQALLQDDESVRRQQPESPYDAPLRAQLQAWLDYLKRDVVTRTHCAWGERIEQLTALLRQVDEAVSREAKVTTAATDSPDPGMATEVDLTVLCGDALPAWPAEVLSPTDQMIWLFEHLRMAEVGWMSALFDFFVPAEDGTLRPVPQEWWELRRLRNAEIARTRDLLQPLSEPESELPADYCDQVRRWRELAALPSSVDRPLPAWLPAKLSARQLQVRPSERLRVWLHNPALNFQRSAVAMGLTLSSSPSPQVQRNEKKFMRFVEELFKAKDWAISDKRLEFLASALAHFQEACPEIPSF